jgi:hypothetical protein
MANNTFKIKRTSVTGRTPNTSDPSNTQYIAAGELALNMVDSKLYSSNGTVLLDLTPAGSNLNVNSALTANNSGYLNSKSEANLNVNNSVTSNSTTYINGNTAADLNTYANTKANSAYTNAVSYTDSVILTANGAITGNAATAYSNATSYTDTRIGTVNTAITSNSATAYSNATSYVDTKIGTVNTAITSNAATAYSNATSYADTKAGTAYSNATSYVDTKIGTVNTAITSNAATAYSNATSYADTKAATAYSNATSYVSAQSFVNTSQLSSNLSNYQTTAGLNANIASYLPNYSGTVNATSITATTATFTGNVSVKSLIITGNVEVIGANNLSISDNMIYLNSNSTYSNPDLGFAANYNDGTYHHTGIFRDHASGTWKVFDNYQPEPDASQYIDQTNTTFHIANFQANTIYVGNTTVYSTINTTFFNATANNTSFVGSIDASNVVSNAQLSSNLSNYQTTAGLSSNVATLTSNNTSFVGSVSATNVVSNAQLSGNLSSYQTTAGLSSNVATLSANNTSYLGGVAAASYVNTSGNYTVAGNINFTGTNTYYTSTLYIGGQIVIGAAGVTANATGVYLANTATLVVGNSTVNTVISQGVINTTSIVNAASHTTGTTGTGTGGLVANSTIVFLGNNTVNAAINTTSLNIGGNPIANSTGANNAFNLGGTAAANYLTNSGSFTISGVYTHSNTLIINNNKGLNFQTINASAYVSFIQQSDDNFVMYSTNTTGGQRPVFSIFGNSLTSSLSFSTPVTFNVNASLSSVVANGSIGSNGQLLTSNGTGVYWSSPGAASVNVAAQYTWTNTQTFSNTITFNGSILGSTINAASYTVGTAFIANSTQLTINAVAVSANGTTGTSGQVLTSNGTGAYWSNTSGNLPVIQSYTGDGTTNTFTVTGGYIANNISVYVNGSRLRNGTEANVQSGSTFTILSGNPPSGALIDVVGVSGLLASGAATLVSQTITANGTANSFAISGGYLSNTIMVWLNGVKQINGTDVIVTSGANVGFVVTPPNNYIIDVFGYQSLAVTTAGATSNAKLYAISMFIGG